MSLGLRMKTHNEFFDSKVRCDMVDEYIRETTEMELTKDIREQAKLYYEDKEFFEIEKDNKAIGFGAFKYEYINGIPSFMLYEFYIIPEYRDIQQLFQIKKQLIIAIRMFEASMWACCVDNLDLKKQKAYSRLGFQPMFDYEDLTYMGMEIEGL